MSFRSGCSLARRALMRTLRNVFYRQPRAPGQPLPCSRVSEDGQAGRDQLIAAWGEATQGCADACDTAAFAC